MFLLPVVVSFLSLYHKENLGLASGWKTRSYDTRILLAEHLSLYASIICVTACLFLATKVDGVVIRVSVSVYLPQMQVLVGEVSI